MTILENPLLKVGVKNPGAELCSLFNKKTQMEYLWQAGKEWPKHSPVLFPIVGQLKNDTYSYQGKNYAMPRHGFARTLPFALAMQKTDTITFSLHEDNSTLANYPFHFRLDIRYQLEENKLIVAYDVTNTGSNEMPFSIGAHPAFKVPLTTQENYADYYLMFNSTENACRWILENGLLKCEEEFFNSSNRLPLTNDLFNEDALVFKHLRSDRIELLNKNHRHGIAMSFKGFPYMGIWAAKNADFVCIEPWHGIADSVSSNGNIFQKEGIIILKSEESFKCHYVIDVY